MVWSAPSLSQPVGKGRCCRLVDDAEHLEAGDLASFLGGRPLGVVEVGRHGDDGLVHDGPQVGLGVPLQLLEGAGRDLLGGVVLAVDVLLPGGSHLAFHRPDGAARVGDGLALGNLADEHLTVLRERHDRRCRPGTLGVGDHDGVTTLEDGYHRVGGSEVYSYGLAHGVVSFFPAC
jgi:NAD-specific glutamate dehydrogenase.